MWCMAKRSSAATSSLASRARRLQGQGECTHETRMRQWVVFVNACVWCMAYMWQTGLSIDATHNLVLALESVRQHDRCAVSDGDKTACWPRTYSCTCAHAYTHDIMKCKIEVRSGHVPTPTHTPTHRICKWCSMQGVGVLATRLMCLTAGVSVSVPIDQPMQWWRGDGVGMVHYGNILCRKHPSRLA